MTDNVSINQIPNIYPDEAFDYLGLKETPAERTFYRTIERIGDNFRLILELHQQFLVKKQITFGISTEMNNIPTALTIQKGNVQDKNKKMVRDGEYQYLTFLQEKKKGNIKRFEINDIVYEA